MCQYLKNLSSADIQRLGEALGLLYPTLQKMSSFPDEMVAAWLNRQDNVLSCSGEPTWSTLEDALRKIGQTGLAEDVKTEKICHSISHESSDHNTTAQSISSNENETGLLLN